MSPKATPETEPEPEPEPEGDGGDEEEKAWQRLAPKLKQLHRETLNEWLDEIAASAPAEEKDEPETASGTSAGRVAAATGRPAGGDGGTGSAVPKVGGREKAPGKAAGTLRSLLFGS